ncbi:MAG: putative bifunctional diguanylate cyclase/phosphodiesterase [Acidimicrobiia bacterium]
MPDAPGSRASMIVAAVGTGWVLAIALGLLGSAAELTFVLLGLGAPIAMIVGICRSHPVGRAPWIAMGSALIAFLVGGALRVSSETLGDLSSSRSLLPDLVTLPGYLLLGVGLLGIARIQRGGRRDIDGLLDGAIAALAALTLAWIYLVNPALFHSDAPLSVRVLLSCYPPLSVFLVAIAARIAFGSGHGVRRAPAYYLLLGAMLAMLVGDVMYMLVETNVASIPQNLLDVPYAMTYVAVIALVLHPSMRDLTEAAPEEPAVPGRGRLAFVAVALGVPGLITVTRVEARPGDRIMLTVIVVLLTATATWRMLRAIRAYATSQERLAHQATHDTLTGLPNRTFVQHTVDATLATRSADDGLIALLFLDIDRFKLVNDSQGHGLGDELLRAVAARLKATTRPGDLVARVGGDEFVVVVHGLRTVADALEVGERTRLAFAVPFTVREDEIASSVSIGIAVSDPADPLRDAEALLRDADTAMYQAKEAGRDAVTVFDASMRDRATQRLALEHDLRQALERGELHLHYQPVVKLPDGEIKGFEALLRWAHPTRGQIPPIAFIPVAEDTGLIVPIGAWVIREACRQLAQWRKTLPNGRRLTMAVNLSARQLRDPQLVQCVRNALHDEGLSPGALCLELTESLLMNNAAAAADLLETLRSLDVKLSIDDFGTGYSSLSYLRRFRVDNVKIDRSFVDGLDDDDSSDETLVAAILAMAKALRVATVAEGVETTTQAERLHALGCQTAQGYLFSRPVPADQVPSVADRLGVVRGLNLVRDSEIA